MDLSTIRADLATALAATGIRVSTDAKHAHAPCILVGPITEVTRGGVCVWDAEMSVWLVAPAPGDQKAVDWLAANITAVLDVCGGEATASLGSLDVGGGTLPAFEITYTVVAREGT